jgi:hypothetical protein
MSNEHLLRERILSILQPFASNWSGSLGRGDLVIPHGELAGVVRAIVTAFGELAAEGGEVSEAELFQVLAETRRLSSIQDQVTRVRERFRVVGRRR